MAEVIETHDLTKVYESSFGGQDVLALNKVNLAIEQGEIYGYLGPNGSGKTTTIKMLLGLIFPSSGTIKVLGKTDIGSPSVRKSIGYLPEGAYYPDFLRGEEVLRFYGQLYGLGGRSLERRIAEVLEIVGMTRARKRLIRGYSKGMRQRIGLAQALLSDPQILVLDEPTTGLDPVARKEMRDLLVDLRNQGKTLFISSHELLEVELISNRIGILFEGELQTQGKVNELLTERDMLLHVEGVTPEALAKLSELSILAEDQVGSKAALRIPPGTTLYQAVDILKSHNISVLSIAPRRETLEELFVRVVGEASRKRERVQ